MLPLYVKNIPKMLSVSDLEFWAQVWSDHWWLLISIPPSMVLARIPLIYLAASRFKILLCIKSALKLLVGLGIRMINDVQTVSQTGLAQHGNFT